MTTVVDQTLGQVGVGAEYDSDLEKITELEKFDPTRVDGVGDPANGFPILMMKALGATETIEAEQVPAATQQEGHITTATTEPASPDVLAEAEASPPAGVEKGAEADTVTVEIPKGASISISPADLAKLNTFKQQLVLEQNGVEGDAVKRDMDPAVGGGVDRDKLKASDFVFPDTRDFPVVTPADVSDAVSSWGRYKGGEGFAAFKSKLTALAKRKGPKFTAELPDSWSDDATKTLEPADPDQGEAAKAGKPKKGGNGKKKPFPGAAPKFDGKDSDSDGDGVDADKPGSKKDDEKKPPKKVKPGSAKKGAKDCPGCGKTYHSDSKQRTCENCGHDLPNASKSAGDVAKGDDDVVCLGCGHGIDEDDKFCKHCGKANPAADDGAQKAKGKDATAHLEEHNEPDGDEVGPDIDGDGDGRGHSGASDTNNDGIDDRLQHAAKTQSPAYFLARLHDATCAAYHHDDVIAAHPLLAKGLAELADPAPFAAMVTAAIAEDAGTGTRAADLPSLSAAYHAAVAMKAAAANDGLLEEAMDSLRKAFADYYPDAHPKPGTVTPGQFHRPYVASGRANQSAKPGQKPRVPLSSHVPSPDDFNRPLITAGREAASPGSKPSGVGKARMYYSNAGKQGAATVLAAMHDWIADNHPTICPMTGVAYDNEPGVDVNSMGSSLTTAQPMPTRMTATGATNSPTPVAAVHAASLVTPGPARNANADKPARKEAKMARKAAEAAAAAVPQSPLLDPELLKTTLREIVAEALPGAIEQANAPLVERMAALESSPDPAQMAPRSGAAALGKTREASQEVPAGGDGHSTQRLMRLMKKTQDPDSGVRVAAIGELTELVGRETAAELLGAAN